MYAVPAGAYSSHTVTSDPRVATVASPVAAAPVGSGYAAVYGAPIVSYGYQPTYAAIPSGGASYVPPPVLPIEPQRLTQGMPDPKAIETQKAAYNKSLEDQAKQGEDMLRMQQQQQTDYIRQAAEAEKKRAISQIEQQAKQQELQLSQKYVQQVMSLQQEFQHQKLVLEKQANDLAMEWQRRKAHEEMTEQQYTLQQAHYEDQMKIMGDIQRQAQEVMVPMHQSPSFVPAPAMQVGTVPMPPTMLPGGSFVHAPVQQQGSHVSVYARAPVAHYAAPSASYAATALPSQGHAYTAPSDVTNGYYAEPYAAAEAAPAATYAPPTQTMQQPAVQYQQLVTQYQQPATQYAVAPTTAIAYAGAPLTQYEQVPATAMPPGY